MFFHRHWLLILSLLILGGGQVLAASREDRAFAAASAAFKDGIYGQAETALADFVQEYPRSPRVPEAVLMQAQAQFKQEKYNEVINLLTSPKVIPGPLADRFAYWLGEAEFYKGDFERASETFAALVVSFPDSPLRLTALVEAAAAFQRLGDWPRMTALLGETNGFFARRAAKDPAGELVVRGRLLLARAQLAQENYSAALATLKLLEPQALTPDLDWQRANLQCRVLVGAGDLEAALADTTNLVQIARTQDAWRLADSVAWRGTVLERLDRWAEAGGAWRENLSSNTPPDWQREAVLRIANAALVQKKFPESIAALEEYLAKYTNAAAAEFARLTLGELHLREYLVNPQATNQLALAEAGFDELLSSSNNPVAELYRGRAALNRGWCRWLASRYPESLSDFRAAATALPFSTDLAVARFKSGDAMFVLGDFAGARAAYQGVLDQFANVPVVMDSLASRALYQILRADMALTNAPGAESAMRQLLEKYPASNFADESLLLLGEAFSDWGMTTNSFRAFEDFARIFPNSSLTPQVVLARARALERAQDWPAAVQNYEQWLKDFPTNTLRTQTEYALGRAQFLAGNETNAFAVFTNFVARHPAEVALAPLAQWWVADYYYRLGGANFSEAEKNYELIFQNPAWKSSPLYYPSQLMAARAAMARAGFKDADSHLTKLLTDTNCPAALATQALFSYGSLLMRMDSPDTNRPNFNFEQATNVFTKLRQDNPTNEIGALACGSLADCYLQLGLFADATNAYAQVMNWPGANVTQRSRAQVGMGTVFEKMAETAPAGDKKLLLDQALASYLAVFFTSYGKGLGDEETASEFWIKKAGLQALPLISAETCPTNFFDRMESLLPSLKESLEKKRAALKN